MICAMSSAKETMIKTAKSEPVAFFATCARLIPKDVQITLGQRYRFQVRAQPLPASFDVRYTRCHVLSPLCSSKSC
jgi:hypothetical protein